MATRKKTTTRAKFSTGMSGIAGFSKKGKNADGKNVTFEEVIHYVQDDMYKRTGTKYSLATIKQIAYHLFAGIADNLGKGDKVCVTCPELGSFKTSVRKYSIGGKSGRTKTVKFTANAAFRDNAKLGAK